MRPNSQANVQNISVPHSPIISPAIIFLPLLLLLLRRTPSILLHRTRAQTPTTTPPLLLRGTLTKTIPKVFLLRLYVAAARAASCRHSCGTLILSLNKLVEPVGRALGARLNALARGHQATARLRCKIR